MKNFKLIFIVLILMSVMHIANASIYDAIFSVLEEQYGLQQQTLPGMRDHIEQSLLELRAIQSNLNGHYGYGRYLNSDSDMQSRLWSSDKWTDVLKKAGQMHPQFQAAQQRYEQLYATRDVSRIRTTLPDTNVTRRYYDQTRHLSRAALAASEYGYDTINEHIRQIHQLIAELESHPEEKAALDLNARLVAELGFIQLEMLKQQTIQNQLSAHHLQSDVNEFSEESRFLE